MKYTSHLFYIITYSDAAFLATNSYNYGFSDPEAHRDNGKVLNMQHIHPLISNTQRGHCHIFFAIPVLA